jgi:hypothetical protein
VWVGGHPTQSPPETQTKPHSHPNPLVSSEVEKRIMHARLTFLDFARNERVWRMTDNNFERLFNEIIGWNE